MGLWSGTSQLFFWDFSLREMTTWVFFEHRHGQWGPDGLISTQGTSDEADAGGEDEEAEATSAGRSKGWIAGTEGHCVALRADSSVCLSIRCSSRQGWDV